MATVGSFTGFAQKPDLAGAAQRGQALQLQAAQAAAQLKMQHAQLRQQRELAQMESALRQQQLERDANFRSQALKIDGEYKQQMMGLKERQIEMQEAQVAAQAQQAAMQMQAQHALAQELAQIENNPALTEADRESMQRNALLRHGAMGATIPGAGGILRAGAAGGAGDAMMELPTQMEELTLPSGEPSGAYGVRTSRTGRQLFIPPQAEQQDDVLTRQILVNQIASIDRELRELRQGIRGNETMYQRARAKTDRQRSDLERRTIEAHEADVARAAELEREMRELRSSALSGGGQQQQSAPARLRFNPQTGEFETR